MSRLAVGGDIRGRCTSAEIELTNAACDERRAFEFAAPHRTVHALFNEIRSALAACKLQMDVGIAGKETRQCGDDDKPSHQCRDVHPQLSSGCSVSPAQG